MSSLHFRRLCSAFRALALPLPTLALLAAISRSGAAQTTLKVNAATTLLGVPGVGVERVLGPRTTFQLDLTASLWKSIDHAPARFAILIPEWRYHLRDGHVGPYVGVHAGVIGFRVQKWDWRNSDFYQEGFGAVFGGTVGYKRRISERLVLDWYFGGGTAQSKYKGYAISTGERYDGEEGWNESGEWLPYRGGVMLTFRLP
jgi:Protein of unknown function (DUF3575)